MQFQPTLSDLEADADGVRTVKMTRKLSRGEIPMENLPTVFRVREEMATSMTVQLRKHWRDLLEGRPGNRFMDRYERARRKDRRSGVWRRLTIIVLGCAALLVGAVLTVIPGPAVPFFFIGGGLLATESRPVARLMDWFEIQIRKVAAWIKRRWKRLPKLARVALLILGACCSAASAYLTYRFVSG